MLSCFLGDHLRHFPIYQHGDDAFFSFDAQNIIHGLNELIQFYQQNINAALPVKLGTFSFVPGNNPPIELCKNGKNRLWHRAVTSNNLQVVREIIMSNAPNLDVKDEEGRTVLHLACLNKKIHLEIVRLLIDADVSILLRDSYGKIPFHYAVLHDRREIVELMIAKNPEVIQRKDSETLEVALHLAARHGKTEIVKSLLNNGAAITPKNKEGKFPIDLAADGRHVEIVKLLTHCRAKVKTSQDLWNHGSLSRDEAHELLKRTRRELRAQHVDASLIAGLFLVRWSKKICHFVISMLHNDDFINYEIEQTVSESN